MLFITVFMSGLFASTFMRDRKNEVTVVNHSTGPVLIRLRCFNGDEEVWYTFALAHNGSEDFEITCADLSEPETEGTM